MNTERIIGLRRTTADRTRKTITKRYARTLRQQQQQQNMRRNLLTYYDLHAGRVTNRLF